MGSHFSSTVANGMLAPDIDKPLPAEKKSPTDKSTKSLIDSLGLSQDYLDYQIPKELAPECVKVVGDYVPISHSGGQDNAYLLANLKRI
ncbi:hypothetical protein Bca4012_067206 [Brassica carinata]